MTLAQRAFAAAEILALAAALIFLLLTILAGGLAPLAFAHRLFCAVAIFALAEALILRFLRALVDAGAGAPRSEANFLFKASILALRPAARRSCVVVNDNRLLMVG